MKKINKSEIIPNELANFHLNNPDSDWEAFRNNFRDGYKQVKDQLIGDQRGLCAYCEINLELYNGNGLDDFRVEHFHPKTPHNPPPNNALEWRNMLGVCLGGNTKGVGNPSLFTPKDFSCDVPKGDLNLTDVILNPISDVPEFPPLFEFSEDGIMNVSSQCPPELENRARETINYLRLSPATTNGSPHSRLIRFRKAIIDQLREQFRGLLDHGLSDNEAASQLAEIYFSNDDEAPWPSFFSCIRWYLGPAAETRLQAINYCG